MIPYNKPFIVGKELYYIAQAVLVESQLSGNGSFTKKCQSWMENHLGVEKALLTHSCTGALEMAAILSGIKPGDEVIMPSYTFVSTANAFVLRGAVPVFVDIKEETMNIDENIIEDAITKKTKAIVPVHYAGAPCNMDKIIDISIKNELVVIEDAAQCFYSSYKGKKLGTIGQMGCLSFHETKNVISGEGGALLINNEKYVKRAEIIWEKGTNRKSFLNGEADKYTWVDIGSSFQPSEQISAFLYAQLEHADKIIEKRKKLYGIYLDIFQVLAEKEYIKLPTIENRSIANGHIFYIITKSEKERKLLIKKLQENNIMAVFHYIPLHSSPAGKKYGKTHGDLKITNDISARILRLPLYYEMNEIDIYRISEVVRKFYEKRNKN